MASPLGHYHCLKAKASDLGTGTFAGHSQACEDGDALLWRFFDVHVVARTPEPKSPFAIVRELKLARTLPVLQSQLSPVKMGTLFCRPLF